MDMTLRLLIFIEVVNTVKVLIMQNIEFLRSKAKTYHCIIASCIKQLQIILCVDVGAVLNNVLNETDSTQ